MKRKLVTMLTASIFAVAPAALANTADDLNELLQGELSAVETYKQALKSVSDEPGAKDLKAALSNHESAVKSLNDQVKKAGGTPTTSSGAWGTWAATVTGTAKVLGDQAALKALKEGEEHGIKEYKEALEDEDVPESTKKIIRDKFLPNQQAHIHTLDKIMEKL